MYLFDFPVFFKFWSCFGALLMALCNFVDAFLMIFQLLNEFRWFCMALIQKLIRFWCDLLVCFWIVTNVSLRFSNFPMFFKFWSCLGALLLVLCNFVNVFLEDICDFEQFSWAPVQDFSKNTLFLEHYLCIFSIFPCFSRFDQVLEHCLWCFGISLMLFWWFFNFWTSFADFGWIWSKIQHGFDAFS